MLLQAFHLQVRLSSALVAVELDVLLVAVEGAGVLPSDELLSSGLADMVDGLWGFGALGVWGSGPSGVCPRMKRAGGVRGV